MDHLNDFPKRDKSHTLESKAESAFESCLAGSDQFFIQASDRKDYGTDYQIEVTAHGQATNVRLHVQLKGTEKAPNADGSVSVETSRSNLNYLLMNPYAFYVCYHRPTDSLRICSAESVLRRYEQSKKNWSEQQTLTVTFRDLLTDERLKSLAALAKSGAVSSRDKRAMQSTACAEKSQCFMYSANVPK